MGKRVAEQSTTNRIIEEWAERQGPDVMTRASEGKHVAPPRALIGFGPAGKPVFRDDIGYKFSYRYGSMVTRPESPILFDPVDTVNQPVSDLSHKATIYEETHYD